MNNISNLTVVLILLSLVVVREIIRSNIAQKFDCSYGENIFLDHKFYTSSSLVCSFYNHFTLSLTTFFSIVLLSFLFGFLGDRRVFSLIFCFAFFFLLMDILLYYYSSVNYSFLILFLPVMFFSVAMVKRI